MKRNKNTDKRAQIQSLDSKNTSTSGIRSLFKHPANLYQPKTESSGVFTKNNNMIRYK